MSPARPKPRGLYNMTYCQTEIFVPQVNVQDVNLVLPPSSDILAAPGELLRLLPAHQGRRYPVSVHQGRPHYAARTLGESSS